MSRSPLALRGFFCAALLWLPACLALWYPAREWLAAPAGWLATMAMESSFRWVTGSEVQGGVHVLLTTVRVWSADNRLGELAPEVNAVTYTYGAPLLAALMLASRTRQLWWKLPAGLLALLPFQAWGIAFTWLLQVAVVAGAQTAGQTRLGQWEANLIALGYQLGFLILPPLVPVALWLAFDRRVLANAMIEGALAVKTR